jgi:cell division protein FtsL
MTLTRSAPARQLEPPAAPRPARRPSARMTRASFAEGLTAIALAGALLLGASAAAAAVTQAGYDLDHAQHQLAQAQDGERRLEVQVASLQAPARLAAIATTRLGMSEPSTFETVRPLPVQNVPAPQPHAAVIAVAADLPGPGSVRALWEGLRTFVAHMR